MESNFLLQQFADSRPAELAALMADAEIGELCELFASLPASTSARLAARLPSRILFQLLAEQAPAATSEMLFGANHDDAMALVAHLQESRYPEILMASQNSHRKKLRRLFEFPSHSLSAIASPEFLRVTESTLCEVFCKELVSAEQEHPRPIFAVNDSGVYRGVVNVYALIATSNRTKSVKAVANYVPPLHGDISADAALNSPEWLEHLALPVTDGKQRIIGAVTRAQLLRLVPDDGGAHHGLETILSELAAGYLSYCTDIMKSLFTRNSK
ncbi:MAG: Mg/Co/Ni transporter MgtE [Halieaceae bacterium]|jgi:Mg/Co/Ni transporter MgtE